MSQYHRTIRRLPARILLASIVAISVVLFASSAMAQSEQNDDEAKPAADAMAGGSASGSSDTLSVDQRRIAEKYRHLEEVLLRMAELNAASDPRRAALLRKAVAQSKEQLIGLRLETLVELLGKDQLSRALDNQTQVDQDLRALLELLMSENRAKSIENEKARIREYLKQLGMLIKQEKDIQGRTVGGDQPKRLAGEQGRVADNTGGLAKQIQKNEEKPQGSPKKPAGEREGSGKDQSGKQGQGRGKDGNGGDSQSGKPEKDKNENGQGDEQQQNPARRRLEAAQQRMKEAEEHLKAAKLQNAAEKEEDAIRELEQAKAKLEEILRQLREEEIERILAMLEARFRKMLQMQEEVYDGTVRLDKVPLSERTHNHEIEASRLSGKESQIVVEVDKAALLLREDGSAVAFPEAIEQMRDDMQQVVSRLAQTKVEKITQSIEEDIIAAIKDMLTALKKAQKDQKDKKKPKESQPGQQGEPPLIDMLAELRMIRALQMRVNTRTTRYSRMIEGEQANNAELVEAIRRLAEREQRIYRVTKDLEMGKNQ